MQSLANISTFLKKEKSTVFSAVVKQLQKDFELSGLQWQLPDILHSETFTLDLYTEILKITQTNFDDLLQLLYRVDVNEKQLYSEKENYTLEQLVQNATVLILERTLKKIAYRLKYN